MRMRQDATYLQFLSDYETLLCSDNLQTIDSSGFSTSKRNEIENFAQILLKIMCNELAQLFLRVLNHPPEEIVGFLIIIIQYLRQDTFALRITECIRR